jgi:hypothetical protein
MAGRPGDRHGSVPPVACPGKMARRKRGTVQASRLVVRPTFPVGKVPPLKVGTKESYKIVSQSRDISDDGHGLPAAGMRVEAQSELPSAQRGGPSDGDALVHAESDAPEPPGPTRAHSRRGRGSPDAGRRRRPGSAGVHAFACPLPRDFLSRGLRRRPVGASLQRIAGESPPEGMGPVAVPGGEERQYRRPELCRGVKAPRAQTLPLQDAEEQLDLVHPRGMFRGVVSPSLSLEIGGRDCAAIPALGAAATRRRRECADSYSG